MSDLKWICTYPCQVNNHIYSKGDIVIAPTNPSSASFTQFYSEEYKPVSGRQDLDGTYYYGATGWEDFKFPLSSTRLGSNNKPDYDFTDNGYLFPQNVTTEILYASDQFPHSMCTGPGAIGKPHLHLIQAADAQVVFKLKYRIIDNGGTVPSFTTLTSTGYAYTYVSGSLSQILIFPDISLAGVGTSALIDVQLYRQDNAYTGDILVKSVDIHIPLDSLGSGQEYVK